MDVLSNGMDRHLCRHRAGLPLLLLIIANISVTPIDGKINMTRHECGKSKGCLFKPTGCDPQLDCTLGMIFFMSGYNTMTVQLTAQSMLPPPLYQYIAIGFSKDQKMGDDFVTECVMNPVPGSSQFNDVEVFASYNVGKSNDRIYLNSTEHALLYDSVEGEVLDARLTCQFNQQLVPQFYHPSGRVWNLDQRLYYMIATGSAQSDEINVHDTSAGANFYPIFTSRAIPPMLATGPSGTVPTFPRHYTTTTTTSANSPTTTATTSTATDSSEETHEEDEDGNRTKKTDADSGDSGQFRRNGNIGRDETKSGADGKVKIVWLLWAAAVTVICLTAVAH